MITILVATMSGTAEMAADEILDRIEDAGLDGRIVRMEKMDPAAVGANGPVIICSSTYGEGEIPDNGKGLFAALEANRPDLSGLHYGVVALGDRSHAATYCEGGKRFDALLHSLGATRIGERLECDARSSRYADEEAGKWTPGWVEALRSATGTT